MKKIFFPFIATIFCAALIFSFNACVDKDFDTPPANGSDPEGVVANTTIGQLKNLHNGNSITDIVDDVIIEGIVTANDESGNFFREMFIQDASGGLKVLLDFTESYNDYPEGRRVFINCRGLKIDEFSGIYSIGLAIGDDGFLDGIPLNVVEEYIMPGMLNQDIQPAVIGINDIGSVLGTLVTLEDVQFIDGEIGGTFADGLSNPPVTINRNIQDCNGNTVIVRNSGYSNFANDPLPTGNGSLTGIASAFLNDNQMFVRRAEDVIMANTRCDGSTGGGGTGNESQANIADIRSVFTGGGMSAPAETKIRGVVISDRIESNIVDQNVVIQDATGGIVVRFNDAHFLNLNDEVEIVISGQELSEFNGLLQVNNVSNNNASVVGTGNISPVSKTISEITSDLENLESTLVEVSGATLTGGNTYNGALTLDDGTGAITVFTRSGAGFSGALAPTNGEDVTMVAIVSQFNDAQLVIRNLNDVTATGGSGGGGGDCDVDENFQSGTQFDPVNLSGWTNAVVEGSDEWIFNSFDGNTFARLRGFQATSSDIEGWLVTPEIDLSTQKVLNFNSAQAFWAHDGLTVMFSSDFTGNVENANWTDLNPTLAGSSTPNYDWVNSGDINLPVGGTGYVAFRYIGDNSSETTTYRVDDVQICEP